MFSNKSSSPEISSVVNGSTQNFEGNGVDVSCRAGELAAPALYTCGNEPLAEDNSSQLGSKIPTKPVPDMRDSNNRTNNWPGDVGSQTSSMSSTSLASSITSTAAQSTNIESTMQNGLFSKDAPTSAVPSLSAFEVATCSRSLVKPLHTGCDSCCCCNHHPDDSCASCLKSEACSHVCSHKSTTQSSVEGANGSSEMEASAKSVISSSSGMVVATEMELLPPSDSTSSGAPMSTPAVFACDLDSSGSNKLHAQRFNASDASGNALPTESKQHHQNQITTPAAETEIVKQFPGHLIPSWEEKLTTGALSDQDNNYNKANLSNNNVKEHSQLGGGDAKHINNAWSQTPFNIPEAERDGNSRVPQAIQATVQGINDSSNPPASFNNNVNDKINDNGTAPVLDKSTASLNDYACLNLPSDIDHEASLSSKSMDVPYNSTVVFTNQNKDLLEKIRKEVFKPQGTTGKLLGPASNARWGIPQGLGLRGGGESSLNNGTTGWGTPPGGNNNSNNNANNSNNNPGANSAAAASWGTPNSTSNPGSNQGGPGQWGAPNNNRTNTGNNQNSGGPLSAGQSPPQSNAPGQPTPTPQPGPPGQPNQPTGQQPPPGQPQPQPNPTQPPPTSQPPPQNGGNPWSQGGDMGPNQPPPAGGPPNNNNGGPPGNPPTSGTTTPSAPSTKQQLEQLNTMREALFSQDGWGGQNVNQDTGWDIPSSPEPVTKDNNGGPPSWKPSFMNGTDLWEANLRNGGQPPPQTQQKTPWGHTPTTNIGGTWGEDDEVSDSSNMWTGVPANPGPSAGPGVGPQWGTGGPGGPGVGPGVGPSVNMWGGPPKDEWNCGGNSNWGEPRGDPHRDPHPRGGGGDPRMGGMGDPRDLRNVSNVGGMDPRDMRANDPRDIRGDMMRDPMRGGPMDPMRDGMRDPRGLRGMGDMPGGDPMMRGDPRGISGRLNGVNDPSMWGQPPQPPHHNMPHHQQNQPPRVGPGGVGSGGNFPGGVNQWAGPPPKDMGMPGAGSKPSGWEEPSPPAQRRNIPAIFPNVDDGTSLWGPQQNRGGGKVSHWKDMPVTNRPMPGCPPGMPQNRMPGSNAGNMKPDGPLWSHPGRNGSWDGPHDGPGANPWVEDPKSGLGGMNNWNEPPLTPSGWGGPKPKNPMNPAGGWMDGGDMDTSWGQPPKSGPKPIAKEMIWASKQFRMLADMGFKKDDVENALRVSNMNLENALEMLNTSGRSNMDAWRGGHDDHGFDFGSSNHPAGGSGSAFSARGGFHSAPPIPFAPPKMLQMQQPPPQPPSQQSTPFNQSQRNSQNQPSAQQLQMLVKQIQMAVGAGYLNQQILNQPLSPQTLLLLNQLLQQIKVLQNLTQQHAVASAQKGNNPTMLNCLAVQLTKTKQQISNLQNQIQAQQALYVKHLPQQPPNQDFFKPNMHDPMNAIPNFSDLTIKEPPVMNDQSFQSQQSRLNQWKLPSLDKDSDGLSNEFSRAPGTTSKAPGLAQSHSSPNINPILSQGDGPWASVSRSNSDTGWPDSGSIESGQPDKDWPITSQSNSFSDLVPEFEPGKPWKGNQMKSIEDDPSITPGSVVRSPLSIPALKESEMFSAGGVSKTSPTSSGADILPPLSLSSSTWSYNNTASSSASSFASPLSKLASKGPWGDGSVPTAVTSELWGAPQNKPRGPPPGLSSKNPNGNGNGGGAGGVGGAGGAVPGQGGVGTGSSGSSTSSNGWGRGSGTVGSGGAGSGSGSGGAASWGIQGGAGATPGAGTTGTAGWGSTWLLLKNLTPQIDGSTLKTLCLQHGPLQSFHLYLNHGIALAKYQSREEANKAQAALNNCVLSNTTIFAESPSDSEVHNLLSHLGGHGTAQQQQSGGSAPNWGMRSSSGGAGANSGAPPAPGKAPQSSQDTWGSSGGSNSSQLWASTPTSSVLWGEPSGDQHRATPSAFLPGDLLGGESM